MTYQEAIDFLFNSLPLFSRVGAPAYKEGLETTLALDDFFGHPHLSFQSIHVAGTNGKGSTSQMIYEALRAQGYSVGLYTSPHLVDFRERIVVDTKMISERAVVDFTLRLLEFMELNPTIKPSFFEMGVAMAFEYFRACAVDYAVVEVGMGGRLDSTNIITPELSVITNISFDHTQFLGSTLAEIAAEKAGIIKSGVKVVVGETQAETEPVFLARALDLGSPIVMADQVELPFSFKSSMQGLCQLKNSRTAQVALMELGLPDKAIQAGIESARVRGRWEILGQNPLVVCDTGHNQAGIELIVEQLAKQSYDKLYFVLGVVADKDVSAMLALLPRNAHYIFTQASIPRALAFDELAAMGVAVGLRGNATPTVAQAVALAHNMSSPSDMIFIGGSTFVVADALALN